MEKIFLENVSESDKAIIIDDLNACKKHLNCTYVSCTFIFNNIKDSTNIVFKQCSFYNCIFICKSFNHTDMLVFEYCKLENIVFNSFDIHIHSIACYFTNISFENSKMSLSILYDINSDTYISDLFVDEKTTIYRFIFVYARYSIIDKEEVNLSQYISNIDFTKALAVKEIRAINTVYYELFHHCMVENDFSKELIDLIKVNKPKIYCPESGSFTAYKAYRYRYRSDSSMGYIIAKIEIPKDAKRTSAFSNKCRASKAIIKDLYMVKNLNNKIDNDIIKNITLFSPIFDKRRAIENPIGKTIYPDDFDDDRWNECSNGIHFFMTKKECRDFLINSKLITNNFDPIEET